MELRPYQEEARVAIEREWDEGRDRTLLVLPTGCGKTIVFSMVAKDAVMQGGRVLILAHRGELLEQAADKLMSATGLGCSVEKAEQTSLYGFERVTVGSVQTLMRQKRLDQFAPDHFDTIVVDEAHHALSDSYQTVLRHFKDAKVLGVTATPDRGDRRNLGEYFDSLAYEYTLPKAIKEGYLCPIKAQTIPIKLDLSSVAISSGDFKVSDLSSVLDPYLEQIAEEMVAAGCLDRKTVVFLPLIDTSQKFRDILVRHGFRAAEVNGNSKDRAEVLQDFEDDRYNVLCNSMLLTEGWDCPSVDCIIVLRPTKVRSLYCQMVGRGTRLSPETGKDHLLLLDFLWHVERHELCRPAHLIAADVDVAHAMTKIIEDAPAPLDLEEVEAHAEQDVLAQREESLAKQLDALKKRKRKNVDPLQFEMSIQDQDLANYMPSFAYEMAPMSEKQAKYLDEAGIDSSAIECSGKASLLIDRLQKRRKEGLTTPRQIRQLESRGFQHVGEWSKDDASKLITRIASNGWRTPRGIDPATYVPGGAA
jgi:superfamily II DNA or RNA helicase|nr:MAG TPA: Chromatin remodeling complex ATPase [Caudoviricetes sp.]